ncbi:MAG: hypothetical protein JEY99_03995 [Spirochaetales bacterium]|nr:hypothetical protein [Spirochaetales bacterium]
MKQYESHLYMILYPNPALVASQYGPREFARHYSMGSTRHYDGKVIFAELDIEFRDPFFDIETGLQALVPHEDGRPKATKFIATYRVLEFIDFDALKKLYLTNPDGTCLGLDKAPYEKVHKPDLLRVMAEVAPLRMLVLTNFNFSQYGKWITEPSNPKGAPKVLYTQVDLTIDDFLKDFEENPLMHPPLPSLHPSKLRDAIHELQQTTLKHTKGLGLDCNLNRKSYSRLRHGFMFASQDKEAFFPLPNLEEIERTNYKFFRGMT